MIASGISAVDVVLQALSGSASVAAVHLDRRGAVLSSSAATAGLLQLAAPPAGLQLRALLINPSLPQILDTVARGEPASGKVTVGPWTEVSHTMRYWVVEVCAESLLLFLEADTELDGEGAQTLQVHLTRINEEYAEMLRRSARTNRLLQREKERTSKLARQDPLTGVNNRRHFLQVLEDLIGQASMTSEAMSVMFVDLDNFKKVNDTHGHAAGDEVLLTLAGAIQETIRSSDLVARFGGDEFIILFAGAKLDSLPGFYQRIAAQVATSCPSNVTLSAGGAQLRAEESVEQLIARADQALYRAKRLGRGRIEFAEP